MTAQGVRGVTFALAAALLTAASSASIAAAQAQQVVQGQFTFDIKAKPVPQAVNDIGRIAGLSVVFRENRPISATGNPVRGRLSAEQALATMLAGTGLGYSFSNPTTVQVFEVAVENAAPLSADGATMLDPITIYGARDATSLNDTSASVGIVTAEEIQDSQIRNFRDSFRRMANVMDADWINGGFVIRGVNSEGFNTGANPIGSLYVDGVLQSTEGTRRGARGLWDVEQVEVYRGPQSTLSGRAAMAGAIYIKTKDPIFEKEAEVSATVGNDRLAGTAFMVNTPLLEDQIAMRIAGSFERSKSDLNAPSFTGFDRYDDFMTNLTYNIRGKLLFTPAELPDTKALLSYSFSHDAPTERNIGGPGQGLRWEDKRADFYRPIYTEVRST
jgi:outer membrane receptor protein involved in Fe transport